VEARMNGRRLALSQWASGLVTSLALVTMSVALTGCPKKDAGATDAASSAAPEAAAPAPSAAPEGANESDVKRYPEETKVDHVPATIAWYVVNVRSEASSGSSLISVLKKGTDTMKLASKDNFYLISFTEPSAPGRKLIGWIDQKAYTPQIWDAGKHFITCSKTQEAILLEGGHELCVSPCSSGNDTCPTGQVCDGDAPKSLQGSAGDNVEFCRIGNKKGGTTPPAPVVDSGTTPPAVVDAGTKTDAGGTAYRAAYRHAVDAGSCNQGFFQVGAFCRFVCTASSDCVGGAACKLSGGKQVCQDGL
jgi:hypothetical protein